MSKEYPDNIYPPVVSLAQSIQSDVDYDPIDLSKFHQIASKHLKEFLTTISLKSHDILDWCFTSNIPPQPQFFGQIPITLFYNESFVIDVYYWSDLDTDIHDHSFSGAFTVLQGETLQITYEFEKVKRFHDLYCGDLQAREIKILTNDGNVETISPGVSYIHKTVHLTESAITLCVRTCTGVTPQFGYYSQGIAKSLSNEPKTKLLYELVPIFYKANPDKLKNILLKYLAEKKFQLFLDLAFAYVYQTHEIGEISKIVSFSDLEKELKEKIILQLEISNTKRSLSDSLKDESDSKLICEIFELSKSKAEFFGYLEMIKLNYDNQPSINSVSKASSLFDKIHCLTIPENTKC